MSMHVVVARFNDYESAKGAVRQVKNAGIKLEDQAVVTNNGDGNFQFKEGKDAGGGKGFVYGAVLTGAVGLMLGPVGWGALAAGGVAGGLVSKIHDANIPNNRLEDVGRDLKVGEGAAIAVTKEGDQDQVSSIFETAGGNVEAVGITDDLKQSLEGLAPAGVELDDDGTATAAS
jgi:uncharacterized membrane protein